MSFSTTEKDGQNINVGHLNPNKIEAIVVGCNDDRGFLQTAYGIFRHEDIIGKPFGSKWTSTNGKSIGYALRPNPSLWSLTLSHRTQIIYLADASFIITSLGLKPGSLLLESGTGSGAMTHRFAQAVQPNGHVYTFEYHAQRAEAAAKEFTEHLLQNIITVSHLDVCQNGFPVSQDVDAVFLDLPNPWDVIKHAVKVLKNGGSICTFSPCIEQVQKTINAFHYHGFSSCWMAEVLIKEWQAFRTGELLLSHPASATIRGHTSYLTFAHKTSLCDFKMEPSK